MLKSLREKLTCLFIGHWKGDLYIPKMPEPVPHIIWVGCYYEVVPGCLRCKKEFT